MRPRKPGRASALTGFFSILFDFIFCSFGRSLRSSCRKPHRCPVQKKGDKIKPKKKRKPLVKPSKTRWDPTKFRVKLEFKKKKRMAFKSKRGDWKTGKTSLPTGLWFDYYYWRGLLKRIARILVASLIIYLWAQNRCRYAEMRYGLTK